MTDWKKRAEESAKNFVRDNIAKESAVTSEEKAWAHILEKVTYGSFEEGFSAGRTDLLKELAPVFEALEFYAEMGHWGTDMPEMRTAIDPSDQCFGLNYADIRGGKRARKVLAVLKDIRGNDSAATPD